ncbi:hypothetical protein [Levilactobacillus suantsaiihabitans]|uniref:Uncharacterized protein n=1 Tax=Levilactobacillus suantsaiihabitans TaxID=2487722 RepID=A0A4Z0J9E0_9LACO|nr:hypothetical protein [Levilactobacillus suantsaiihabitans]TGD17616.1 hypothetical protein EGT51_11620 [Levilactobacillus suantsaiihabitans]
MTEAAMTNPVSFKLEDTVKFNRVRTHRYELRITWNQPAKKLAIIIINFPGRYLSDNELDRYTAGRRHRRIFLNPSG